MVNGVSIVRCENYDFTTVQTALQKVLAPFGGIQAFIKPGDKVLVKPNLLSDSAPETAIVTHPTIVGVIVKMVKVVGGYPIIADSPGAGIPYTVKALKMVYQAAGYDKIIQKDKAILNFDTSWSFVANPKAKLIKRLEVINPALHCQKIINLPKFKTHTFTIFSGAVKNMFGIVPGLVKPSYHARLRDLTDFSEMLLDLIALIKPTLNIMDGVIGLEGDGPGALGKIRKINLILASSDAILLDVVASRIAGIDIAKVPFLAIAIKSGLVSPLNKEIKIFGGKLETFKIPDFQMPKTYDPKGFNLRPTIQKLIAPFVKNVFSLKPVVRESRCIGCANCVDSCPSKAIKVIKEKAKINHHKCIRCYCCIESCRAFAVDTEIPWSTRLLSRTGVIGSFQN